MAKKRHQEHEEPEEEDNANGELPEDVDNDNEEFSDDHGGKADEDFDDDDEILSSEDEVDTDGTAPTAPSHFPIPQASSIKSDGRYQNKQRLLVLSSRGVTARYRHLLEDLRSLLPHSKKECKLDVGK